MLNYVVNKVSQVWGRLFVRADSRKRRHSSSEESECSDDDGDILMAHNSECSTSFGVSERGESSVRQRSINVSSALGTDMNSRTSGKRSFPPYKVYVESLSDSDDSEEEGRHFHDCNPNTTTSVYPSSMMQSHQGKGHSCQARSFEQRFTLPNKRCRDVHLLDTLPMEHRDSISSNRCRYKNAEHAQHSVHSRRISHDILEDEVDSGTMVKPREPCVSTKVKAPTLDMSFQLYERQKYERLLRKQSDMRDAPVTACVSKCNGTISASLTAKNQRRYSVTHNPVEKVKDSLDQLISNVVEAYKQPENYRPLGPDMKRASALSTLKSDWQEVPRRTISKKPARHSICIPTSVSVDSKFDNDVECLSVRHSKVPVKVVPIIPSKSNVPKENVRRNLTSQQCVSVKDDDEVKILQHITGRGNENSRVVTNEKEDSGKGSTFTEKVCNKPSSHSKESEVVECVLDEPVGKNLTSNEGKTTSDIEIIEPDEEKQPVEEEVRRREVVDLYSSDEEVQIVEPDDKIKKPVLNENARQQNKEKKMMVKQETASTSKSDCSVARQFQNLRVNDPDDSDDEISYVVVKVKDAEVPEGCPKLTEKMKPRINEALLREPRDEILVSAFKIDITRRDIQTLSGLNWLNDQVVNFYMCLLTDRGALPGYPSVYAFSTFFYTKLQSSGQAGLARWTKNIDIFSYDILIIPLHFEIHWCLCVVDFRKKTVAFYDSMGTKKKQCLINVGRYLQEEYLDKKGEVFNSSGWELRIPKSIPQQMNGSDCGVFMCTFAEYISREAELNFSQKHMQYFRRKMVWEILSCKLLL